jgi:hypothetical protein
MAVYKVIQDIESEDKLLGPLTFKSFIYAAIAGICAFIEFRLFLIGSPLKWLFILLFALPMLLFGVLASPLGREQPTEVWLLSRVRFFLKPRQRIWKMEGGTDLVKITAPKKLEARLTKDLSPTEVQSRLKTLSQTLDTRGWAIKNMNVNLSSPDAESKIVEPSSDRLISGSGISQQTPAADVQPEDDILDEKNNPTAQKFEVMMQKKEAERKRGLLARLKDLVIEEDDHQKANRHKRTSSTKLVSPKATRNLAGEEELQKKVIDGSDSSKSSATLPTAIKTAKSAPKANREINAAKKASDNKSATPVTAPHQTVNMELAQSGSAFSVATLSSLANHQPKAEQTGPNEITISLH